MFMNPIISNSSLLWDLREASVINPEETVPPRMANMKMLAKQISSAKKFSLYFAIFIKTMTFIILRKTSEM